MPSAVSSSCARSARPPLSMLKTRKPVVAQYAVALEFIVVPPRSDEVRAAVEAAPTIRRFRGRPDRQFGPDDSRIRPDRTPPPGRWSSRGRPHAVFAAAGDDRRVVYLTGSDIWNNVHDGLGPGPACADELEQKDCGACL